MANIKGFSPEVRLACQTRVVGPVKVKRLVHDNEDIRKAADVGRDYTGREAELAVMFADIKGFTSFAENHLACDIVHALNRYFNAIGKVIDHHGGYIDKYMGDGIMVLFGLKKDRSTSPCEDAVSAALEMFDS
jgi:adenylate cyclase